MIHVAICDDDRKLAADLKIDLERISKDVQNAEIQVALYNSGEEFLCAVENDMIFHIVFMDIEMGNVNGIEAGLVLREKAEIDDTIIIYISNHENYADALVNVGIFRFMQKPIVMDQLERYFTRALNQVVKSANKTNEPTKLHYKINRKLHTIHMDEIAFIRNTTKLLELYLWNVECESISRKDSFYSSIAEVMKKLPNELFVQCSRSHIVNLNYIKNLVDSDFILADKDETKIRINRTFKSAKTAYMKFRGNRYG